MRFGDNNSNLQFGAQTLNQQKRSPNFGIMEEESSDLPYHTPYNGGAKPRLHDSMINAPTEEKNRAIDNVKSILEKIANEGSNIAKHDLNR